MDNEQLISVMRRMRTLTREYLGKGLTEQDTKNAIIEPILGVIGWPKYDLSRVRAEYRHTSRDNPVDYALLSASKPVMFVEAKALDKDIEDHRFIAQTLSYANVAGVEWAVITNGHRWDLYCVFARTQAANKRFFSVTLDDDDFAKWMAWLTPERLEGNELEQFWRLVVAERAVRENVVQMFAERDDDLVKLIARRTRLAASEVASALQTVRPRFDVPGVGTLVDQLGSAGSVPVKSSTPSKALASPRPEPAPAARESRAPARPAEKVSPKGAEWCLPLPEGGMKPARLVVDGKSYDVATWRELMLAAAAHVHAHEPDRWPLVFSSPAFEGRKGRYVAARPDGMRTPLPIPGGFVEANQSARAIVRLVSRLMAHGNIGRDRVHYEVRE